jgi:hypothetical protein
LENRVEIDVHESSIPAIEASALEQRGAVKRIFFFALVAAAFGMASCNKTTATSAAVTCTTTAATTSTASSSVACTDPVTGISVTISPATISVNVVTTTRFFASTAGGTNTIITWKVNSIDGGNDTVGRIDSNGFYNAPAAPPSPATVTVSATSFEDTNVSAASAVTITPPPVVTISPTTWTMSSGTANTKTFTSTVTGAATTNVDWYVGSTSTSPVTNPVYGGNDTLGRIDANGVYSAPRTPPPGSSVVVTAVSRDFTLSTASSAVTISGYSTSSLQGRFAFSLSGQIASGAFFRAGTFTADGAGNLNSGLEDINESIGVTPGLSFAGTYSVTPDGRGTLQFADGHSPANFDFVLVNGDQLQFTGYDGTGTASGQANTQDATTFAASAFTGDYVFDFAGVRGSSGFSQIGEFASDGAGGITSGIMDINDGGTITSQAAITGGAYSVNPVTGRGTASIFAAGQTLQFSFYVVSRGSAKFIGTGTGSTQRVAGVALQQTPNTTFGAASLNGNFAFLLDNSGSGSSFATAGGFSADGTGVITGGVLDENSGSTLTANSLFGGTYTVFPSGRGVAQFTGARSYVFYLGAYGSAFFQETDSNHPTIVSDGFFAPQQNASFSQSLLKGNYSINTSGLSSGSTVETLTGELQADGAGNIGAGALDINTGGTLTPGQALTGAYATSSSAGRGALTLSLPGPLNQTRHYAVYLINSPQALPAQQIILIGIDSGLPAAGSLFRQF